jgi:hypothetical protein
MEQGSFQEKDQCTYDEIGLDGLVKLPIVTNQISANVVENVLYVV